MTDLRTAIRVSWDDPNAIEDGHRVYRSTSPIDPANLPAPLVTIPAGTNFYVDEDVSPGVEYHYAVGVYLASVQQVSLVQPSIEAIAGVRVGKLQLNISSDAGFLDTNRNLAIGPGPDLLLL